MRKLESLIVVKVQRGWKTDRQIVAQSILRERRTVAIGNLSTRRRDIEDVSAREFLRLEGRNNFLVERRLRDFFRGRGTGRRRRRRRQLLSGRIRSRHHQRYKTNARD